MQCRGYPLSLFSLANHSRRQHKTYESVTVLRLASELYPGVSGGFLGKVWLACLLREDFKIFPAMPSTN